MKSRFLQLCRGCAIPLGTILALGLGVGCKAEHVTSAPVPSGWTVTLGSSGGFTGGGSGYRIVADGHVSAWKRLKAGADMTTTPIGSASDPSLDALYAAMTSPELVQVHLSESGNMTWFLDWQSGDETRRYTWPDGTTPPAAVERAKDAALAAVQDAQGSK